MCTKRPFEKALDASRISAGNLANGLSHRHVQARLCLFEDMCTVERHWFLSTAVHHDLRWCRFKSGLNSLHSPDTTRSESIKNMFALEVDIIKDVIITSVY